MNQILYGKFESYNNSKNIFYKKIKKRKIFFSIIFFFFLTNAIIYIVIFFVQKYNMKKKEILAQNLAQSFSLSRIYNDNVNYSTNLLYNTFDSNTPYIIGLIKIPKLNLNYPILSKADNESLKIAPCRFFGPMPNDFGNLCIAGHNYSNNTIFGKLDMLSIDDEILLQDLNGNYVSYIIYSIYETKQSDLSCTFQDTSIKEVTLVTCNNVKGNRLVIKAKYIF